ncbi:CapA family protein [Streptomyces adustus]|uniref:CapA family protein n=1 Tax=Streptomyces adustus TaxID=1609272 RepID=A0A5N8VQX6_9ACTN|nr:CapA family protein [Streptomyces adustus]MPY37693.1 CapA family protein [Streptomyces adustus]
MIARRRQVALALTAILTAAAACQAHRQQADQSGRFGRPGLPGPSAAAAARGFTLVASGDVIPDGSIIERARFDAGGTGYDFRPMLAGAESAVSRADLALCHLGTVYGTAGDSTSFGSPPEISLALAAAGYDGCATASDHSLDDGAPGIRRTLGALDTVGLAHAGTARTEAEARTVTMLRAGPAAVALLAYTSDTDGRPLPDGQSWAVDPVEENRILTDARMARKAGADVVVVSLNWGTEWQDAPDDSQQDLARRLTAARTGGRPDIDLIIGTHAHVPQAYEKVNGTWVVYGTGDQIAGEALDRQGVRDPRGNQSTLGRFTFAPPSRPGGRWEVSRAEFVPQMFDVDAGRLVDLNQALAQGADVETVRDRIREVVLSRGAAKDGLAMAD